MTTPEPESPMQALYAAAGAYRMAEDSVMATSEHIASLERQLAEARRRLDAAHDAASTALVTLLQAAEAATRRATRPATPEDLDAFKDV